MKILREQCMDGWLGDELSLSRQTIVLRMNQNRYKTKRNNELNIRIRFRDGFLVVKGNR